MREEWWSRRFCSQESFDGEEGFSRGDGNVARGGEASSSVPRHHGINESDDASYEEVCEAGEPPPAANGAEKAHYLLCWNVGRREESVFWSGEIYFIFLGESVVGDTQAERRGGEEEGDARDWFDMSFISHRIETLSRVAIKKASIYPPTKILTFVTTRRGGDADASSDEELDRELLTHSCKDNPRPCERE